MRLLILSIFIIIVNCTARYGTTHTYLDSIKTEPIKPILEQSSLNLEVQSERISASFEESYFLGIPLSEDTFMFPNIIDFATKKSIFDFKGVTLGAAYMAQTKVKADGIHILKVNESSESFLFPLYWKNKSEVTAYPLYLKSSSNLQGGATGTKPAPVINEEKKGKK